MFLLCLQDTGGVQRVKKTHNIQSNPRDKIDAKVFGKIKHFSNPPLFKHVVLMCSIGKGS